MSIQSKVKLPTLKEWDVRHSRENWLWKRGMRHEPIPLVPGKIYVPRTRRLRVHQGGYPPSGEVHAWERPVRCGTCSQPLLSQAVNRGGTLHHVECEQKKRLRSRWRSRGLFRR